jgi:hypothetical protein
LMQARCLTTVDRYIRRQTTRWRAPTYRPIPPEPSWRRAGSRLASPLLLCSGPPTVQRSPTHPPPETSRVPTPARTNRMGHPPRAARPRRGVPIMPGG